MATKPKAILSTHDGREASPITKASNVLFENGQTAQDILNDRQDAMISPVIENSSSMFKVGQGDNVDYSANVVNGAYESMVLKGKSMVNCIQEPSSQDVVLPYEFADGQYVTINDTKESGALGVELKGQTLVNLCNNVTFSKIDAPYGFWTEIPNALRVNIIKGKKYFIRVNIETNTFTDGNQALRLKNTNDEVQWTILNITGKQGIVKGTFVAEIDGSIIQALSESFINSGSLVIKEIMIIEYQDGMENWDIPYFTGMQSVKMPILKSVGKNLFDIDIFKNECDENIFPYKKWKMQLKPNTTYIANSSFTKPNNDEKIYDSYGAIINGSEYIEYFYHWGINGKFVNRIFTTDDTGVIYLGWYKGNCPYNVWDIVEMQIEEGSTATPYEPYKSSILTVNEDVTLRGIGDVQDTLDLTTGELTERISTFKPTGAWSVSREMTNTILFTVKPPIDMDLSAFITCDNLPVVSPDGGGLWDTDIEGIGRVARGDLIRIRLAKTKASTLQEFVNYMQSNPITIQYQLATESIKTVDLEVVDQRGNVIPTLKSWNTTTHIYSEIPENTLYPILSHSNPTYPVILKPSTKYSIVANSYSNDHTNSTINFNLGGATASTTVGNRVTTITTPSTLTSEELVMSGRGNKLNNVMVIEGDVVGDEPYFEGICDCKSPILSNVGKNLVDSSKIRKWDNRDTHFEYPDWIRVKPNTRYITNLEMGCWELFNVNKEKIGENFGPEASPNIRSKLMPSDCYYVKARCWGGNTDTDNGLEYYQKNFVLCEGTVITSQEPYKSNTTTFDQKDGKTIVLRSLPNGACDTLNVETGEYVQRIGEVVLDNSHSSHVWNMNADWSMGDIAVFWSSNVVNMTGNSVLCNKFPSLHKNELILNDVAIKEAIRYGVTSVQFFIRKSRLETPDVAGFKRWLSQNPVTIQYELTTPIISTIDVQGFPYAYENGHVQLSSGSIEQSLTPKVEYSVATNRNGQIRSNQKMVERHQKQLDQLQAIILVNLVNSQYNQTLTTLKYELSRV